MVSKKKIFMKTFLLSMCWPIIFGIFLFDYMLTPLQPLYLIGSLTSSLSYFLNIDGSFFIYLCSIPSLIIYFIPYFVFLIRMKESIVLYAISSLFSFSSAVVGALFILGQHV